MFDWSEGVCTLKLMPPKEHDMAGNPICPKYSSEPKKKGHWAKAVVGDDCDKEGELDGSDLKVRVRLITPEAQKKLAAHFKKIKSNRAKTAKLRGGQRYHGHREM